MFVSSSQGLCLLALFLISLRTICICEMLSDNHRYKGLPKRRSSKEAVCQAGDTRDQNLIPGSGRSPRAGKGTPVFLAGKSHGQRNLVGYSPGIAKSQTRLSTRTRTHTHTIDTVLTHLQARHSLTYRVLSPKHFISFNVCFFLSVSQPL